MAGDPEGRTDWERWHDAYGVPGSSLARRLAVVQSHIAAWLDRTAPDPVTVLSSCAGDGRDLLGVLAARADADRVTAALLEYDATNVAAARRQVEAAELRNVLVAHVDASTADAYVGTVPADLVLLCGIFGNVSDDDVQQTIRAVPQLCAPGTWVIWTRHRRTPDLTPRIRRWFDEQACIELAFTAPEDAEFSVGVHRFDGETERLVTGRTLFTFLR